MKSDRKSASKIIEFLHNCLKKYLEEDIVKEINDKGEITRQIPGIHRVFDPVLLEEIIQYNDKEGNFDRVVAAELAIAQAIKMDPIFGKVSDKKDSRIESLGKKRNKNLPARRAGALFPKQKNKLF